jgi:hypothetical protein
MRERQLEARIVERLAEEIEADPFGASDHFL